MAMPRYYVIWRVRQYHVVLCGSLKWWSWLQGGMREKAFSGGRDVPVGGILIRSGCFVIFVSMIFSDICGGGGSLICYHISEYRY
ncbi:unnamed protein product [Tuber melanosporum]|uniref:(Perigord truffle) hypothetical protein n=1 Tax=Tuber melanosporum (strain Mel28) TaxID=656061 RepID=D5GKN5_TUBMM|nr:uncharacterized protein GSTUM_00009670001 [Tuber melanosporum]CAZ85078.1 unnamed protein product [Tuber melanosporum]